MLRLATIRVPALLSRELEEIAVALCAVKAESVAAAPDDVDADGELRAASDLLGQARAAGGEPFELTGPAGLVRDVLYGLLTDGADALAEACRSYESGASSLERLAAVADSTQARVALFAGFEAGERI